MIIVIHSDFLGYILIRHLNNSTRFAMDFLCVQFHSTIKYLNYYINIVVIKFINEKVLLGKIMKLKGVLYDSRNVLCVFILIFII